MRLPSVIAALCCLAATALADQYPSRSVRVVVAAPPGGLTDIVARSVSQFLHEKLGQPFVVENIAGASSTIGAVQVMRSAPYGYTLLVNPSLFVITPMLMQTQYDVVKDFTPISNFGTVPVAVGINPDIPAKTIQEFIALAKATPDKFTWGAVCGLLESVASSARTHALDFFHFFRSAGNFSNVLQRPYSCGFERSAPSTQRSLRDELRPRGSECFTLDLEYIVLILNKLVVELVGIEPTTSSLRTMRSPS